MPEYTPIAVSVQGAADLSGLGRTLIYEQIKLGKLPTRKCGSRTLILLEDLKQFIAGLPSPQTEGRQDA